MTKQEILTLLRGLKRWDVWPLGDFTIEIEQFEKGDFVKWEDLVAVIAQIEGEM